MTINSFDREAARKLQESGWTLLSGFADQLSANNDEARALLVQEARAAPLDPFCAERFRQRYYRKGYIVDDQFVFEPSCVDPETGSEVVPFDQGEANPDFPGQVRMMPAIPERVWVNPAYREIQERCLGIARAAVGLSSTSPLAWESHLIRLTATPGKPAVASPDVIHFDDGANRMITFIIVIERDSITGGVNLITKRRCAGMAAAEVEPEDIHYKGVIEQPFDGYGFIDSEVAHYVSGIGAAPGALEGARTILIFDFVKLIREPIAVSIAA
jgi:hypothetical protein